MDERRTLAALARIRGFTAGRARAALERARSPADCSALAELAAPTDLAALARLATPADLAALADLAAPTALPETLIDADLRWLDASGAALIPCTSPEYPPLLARLPAAPSVLYALGRTSALARAQIAMVGARNATPGGCAIARGFAMAFARAGLTVTSGLALGIDAASHEGALGADGETIAVCAQGLDRVYPREHAELAARIRERGALVSRFPPGTPPHRRQFPARNRILSGMALATLVVEAAQGSGSLLTAHSALQQKRPLFAVPGSVSSPLSRGCHQLLREGATLAEDASAVLEELGILGHDQPLTPAPARASGAAQPAPPLDKDSEILLDALGFEPVSVSSLMERTGLPVSSIASILLSLELRGRVAPHPGGRYCRLS